MESRSRRRLFSGFGLLLLFLLAFAIFFRESFTTVQVSGNSMYPTFRSGQRLLVCKAYWLVGEIRRNDIVVFHSKTQGEYLIKRVYRLGGEAVDMLNPPQDWRLEQGEYVVPEGKVYVLGDNRLESEDSRLYGPLDRKEIIGKVVILR